MVEKNLSDKEKSIREGGQNEDNVLTLVYELKSFKGEITISPNNVENTVENVLKLLQTYPIGEKADRSIDMLTFIPEDLLMVASPFFKGAQEGVVAFLELAVESEMGEGTSKEDIEKIQEKIEGLREYYERNRNRISTMFLYVILKKLSETSFGTDEKGVHKYKDITISIKETEPGVFEIERLEGLRRSYYYRVKFENLGDTILSYPRDLKYLRPLVRAVLQGYGGKSLKEINKILGEVDKNLRYVTSMELRKLAEKLGEVGLEDIEYPRYQQLIDALKGIWYQIRRGELPRSIDLGKEYDILTKALERLEDKDLKDIAYFLLTKGKPVKMDKNLEKRVEELAKDLRKLLAIVEVYK